MNNILISCFKYSTNRAHKFDVAKNYYQTLQLKPNCTKAAIRNSYLSLAKKYHPDINAHGQQKFTCIQEAYQILSNEQDRKQYDVFYNSHINTQPNKSKQYAKPQPKDQGPYRHYSSEHQQSTHKYKSNNHHHAYEEFKGRKTHYQTHKQEYQEDYEEDFENRQRKYNKSDQQKHHFEAFQKWAQLKKKRQQWTKQFYENYGKQPYNSYKTYKKPRTQQDEQFLKMQHAFSSRNPFAPPKNQSEDQKTDVIKQLGLDEYWEKFKGKFWK